MQYESPLKTCDILQQHDRGRTIDCGRPAKFILEDGRGACGIHGRRIFGALPIAHPAAREFSGHTHDPFAEGEHCGPATRLRVAISEL